MFGSNPHSVDRGIERLALAIDDERPGEAVEGVEIIADIEIRPGGVEPVVEFLDRIVPVDLGNDHRIEFVQLAFKPVFHHVLFALGGGCVEPVEQEYRERHEQQRGAERHHHDGPEQPRLAPIPILLRESCQTRPQRTGHCRPLRPLPDRGKLAPNPQGKLDREPGRPGGLGEAGPRRPGCGPASFETALGDPLFAWFVPVQAKSYFSIA